MSLPVVKSLADSVDFTKSVSPYIPQLYDLPQQILQSISDPHALKHVYLSTNPLISAFAFSLFLSPVFLIVSEINKNYSQVDRFWSILPTVYVAHFVIYARALGLPSQRLETLCFFTTLWSARLTFNYWRKGGYSIGSEDYRWAVLRQHISPSLFFVFNVLFISLAQSVLLFCVATPTYPLLLAANETQDSYELADKIFPTTLGCLVFLAFYADQQQWNYQEAKRQYRESAKVDANFRQVDLDRGFIVTGLWSSSRHPNFAAEQSFWVLLYVWTGWITQTYVNWTVVGAAAYLCLFQASTWFTELITAKKYPEYKEYQNRVGKFLPRLFPLTKTPPGNFSDKRA